MKKYLYILTLCVLSLASCKKDEDPGGTAVQVMANEWFVQVQTVDPSGTVIKPFNTYSPVSTYNTSDNSSTLMWLNMSATDKNVIGFLAKVNVDLGSKSFNLTSGDDMRNSRKITVKNGKVVTNGTVGPVSKAVTDAISFDITVDSNPSVIYQVKGYARTRFAEDDH
ncbi:hypothetical protein HDF26_004030 [Pedobacter cryoconitis]|uniref:lipid-binding protein n=1 Tax=Pedobacter cryoconitis TaxID=188932 RepID=UPI001615A852|nr:lipid-binding protein [Pedobacter cryoconitis]MBB6273570.1 hypothetical protein [Pedobacter cryoconitis]